MKSFGYFLLSLFLGCSHLTHAKNVVKSLIGRTGNGKSYISTLMGCDSKTCRGVEYCTERSLICDMIDYYLLDSIGCDDDRRKVEINYKNHVYPLSSLTYPIYDLLLSLEESKATEVEFYLVKDANNLKSGLSENFLLQFIQENLDCPVNVVFNKFRQSNPDHNSNRNMASIIVEEFQSSKPELQGQSCKINLAPNWREKLFANDLAFVKATISKQQCDEWKSSFNTFKNKCAIIPHKEDMDNDRCEYYGDIGGRHCVSRDKIFRHCKRYESNKGWKTNQDCINRRDEKNRAANQRNHDRQAEHDKTCEEVKNLENKLKSCIAI